MCKCGAEIYIKKAGKCRKCYYRDYMRTYSPKHERTPAPCAMEDCGKPRRKLGLCDMHLYRYKQHGDPYWKDAPGGKWHPDSRRPQTYNSVHAAVSALYGPAKEHPCVGCDGPATQWAYDRSDPDPVIKDGHKLPRGRIKTIEFSRDLSRYLPMCHSCHRDWDIDPEQLWWVRGDN
jgi:hypothetical protein